jgi:hypothetical protein
MVLPVAPLKAWDPSPTRLTIKLVVANESWPTGTTVITLLALTEPAALDAITV